jgi:two-component sensor histidine kinase/putative methionine-R-sulfoxide reductase with GAF domain
MDKPEDEGMGARLERLERLQEILRDFGRLAAESRRPERLLKLACVQAAQATGVRHSKVLRYRAADGDLIVQAGAGWKPGVVGKATLGADMSSPAGRAFQTRRPVRIDDIRGMPEYGHSKLLREHGIVALLNAPVAVDGAVWGVLEVDSEDEGHFGPRESVFLSAMANILGLALQAVQERDHASGATAEARADRDRQDTLMRELMHRDKNDFQMVLSILLMQRGKHRDPDVVRSFSHVMDRVAAISTAHSQLYMRPGQGTIEVGAYLRALCGNLDRRREGVRVEVELARAEMAHERAVCVGLVANELVTNAIKYAFPEDEGTVRVSFAADDDLASGLLVVADDGVGMGPSRPGGSGLGLVEDLAQTIGGSVCRVPCERGTTFQLRFPLVA